jgi:dihydroxyacetone kinase-like protein
VSDGITVGSLRWAIPRIAAKLEASADELNTVDGRLGDGDLGVTMRQGSRAMVARLEALPDDVGMSLLACAQALTGERASSYSTLLATGLTSAAKACKGRTSVGWGEFSPLVSGAIAAMAKRGRSALGDKTVLDALEAIRVAADGLDDPRAIAEAADRAVSEALDRFRELPARQGRARIFAERSVGLDDPGQVAIKRITEALLNTS